VTAGSVEVQQGAIPISPRLLARMVAGQEKGREQEAIDVIQQHAMSFEIADVVRLAKADGSGAATEALIDALYDCESDCGSECGYGSESESESEGSVSDEDSVDGSQPGGSASTESLRQIEVVFGNARKVIRLAQVSERAINLWVSKLNEVQLKRMAERFSARQLLKLARINIEVATTLIKIQPANYFCEHGSVEFNIGRTKKGQFGGRRHTRIKRIVRFFSARQFIELAQLSPEVAIKLIEDQPRVSLGKSGQIVGFFSARQLIELAKIDNGRVVNELIKKLPLVCCDFKRASQFIKLAAVNKDVALLLIKGPYVISLFDVRDIIKLAKVSGEVANVLIDVKAACFTRASQVIELAKANPRVALRLIQGLHSERIASLFSARQLAELAEVGGDDVQKAHELLEQKWNVARQGKIEAEVVTSVVRQQKKRSFEAQKPLESAEQHIEPTFSNAKESIKLARVNGVEFKQLVDGLNEVQLESMAELFSARQLLKLARINIGVVTKLIETQSESRFRKHRSVEFNIGRTKRGQSGSRRTHIRKIVRFFSARQFIELAQLSLEIAIKLIEDQPAVSLEKGRQIVGFFSARQLIELAKIDNGRVVNELIKKLPLVCCDFKRASQFIKLAAVNKDVALLLITRKNTLFTAPIIWLFGVGDIINLAKVSGEVANVLIDVKAACFTRASQVIELAKANPSVALELIKGPHSGRIANLFSARQLAKLAEVGAGIEKGIVAHELIRLECVATAAEKDEERPSWEIMNEFFEAYSSVYKAQEKEAVAQEDQRSSEPKSKPEPKPKPKPKPELGPEPKPEPEPKPPEPEPESGPERKLSITVPEATFFGGKGSAARRGATTIALASSCVAVPAGEIPRPD
jgi:hypothetical protein